MVRSVQHEYPNDSDGDALRRVAAHGSDMSRPMDIDFVVVIPEESVCVKVVNAASNLGYRTKLDRGEKTGELACYCTKFMLATYHGVLQAQRELDDACREFGGYTDGWRTFGNAGKTEDG